MYGDKSFWKVQNQASYSVVSELGVCVEWGEGCAFSEFTVHETKRLHIQNELIYFCKKKKIRNIVAFRITISQYTGKLCIY